MKRKIEWEKQDLINNDEAEDDEDKKGHPPMLPPFVYSPMGAIPMLTNDEIDLYIGHCNFNIDQEIADGIKSVDGVETFETLTRYRFRISVGLEFNPNKVLDKIEQVACGIYYPASPDKVVDKLIKFLMVSYGNEEWLLGEDAEGILFIKKNIYERGNLKVHGANITN